jgi:RNA polymerase sigma-54 factor
MVTALRLDVRQTQGLVLTPQLQQAIRLLQMSNVELAAAVDREVAENPFLDRLDAGVAVAKGADPAPEPPPRASSTAASAPLRNAPEMKMSAS